MVPRRATYLSGAVLGAILLTGANAHSKSAFAHHPVSLWQWPLSDYGPGAMSQDFAEFGGYKAGFHHTGIDVPTGQGNTPDVHAMANGYVAIFVPNDVGCNKDAHTCADHGDGNTLIVFHSGRLYSQYQHMSSLDTSLEANIRNSCKEIGPDSDKFGNARHEFRCGHKQIQITQGQKIGMVGGSGFGQPNSWANHLHFEAKRFQTLNSPEDPYEWGYSTPHPNDIKYLDPVNYLEDTERVAPFAVKISKEGDGKPMTLGPNDGYPVALNAHGGDPYYARQVASATTNCPLGWFKLTKSESYPPPENDYFTTTKFAEMPDVWMCLGTDAAHPWITGP